MKRRVVILVLFLLSLHHLFSQSIYKATGWAIKAGYIYQRAHFAEVGGMVANFTGIGDAEKLWRLRGPSLSCEAGFNDSTGFILGPKFGYEIHLTEKFYIAKVNILNYTDFNKNDLRFVPEVGITALGVLYLSYSYAAPLSKKQYQFPGLYPHRITVMSNIIIINQKHFRNLRKKQKLYKFE